MEFKNNNFFSSLKIVAVSQNHKVRIGTSLLQVVMPKRFIYSPKTLLFNLQNEGFSFVKTVHVNRCTLEKQNLISIGQRAKGFRPE